MSPSSNFLRCTFYLLILVAYSALGLKLSFKPSFRPSFISKSRLQSSSIPHEHPVPLELERQLHTGKSWDVTFIYKGVEKTVNVPETTSILESGNKVFNNDLSYSCLNGVCITCACQVLKGREHVSTAVQSLGDPQIEAGFACACQTFPTGPGIVIKLGTYDECYESQYGQFEKSYGELKYKK